ncbi:hypothetical protein EIP86_008713 [Pleurotus ostreatoroseus]|nr:hypothetical protein EIP86_008713 [Pleurotus ostreatoroseus]
MDATDSTPRPGQPSRYAPASSTAQPSSSSFSSPAAHPHPPSRPPYPSPWADSSRFNEKRPARDYDLDLSLDCGGPRPSPIALAPSNPPSPVRPHDAYPVDARPFASPCARPRGRRIRALKPWIPIILYAMTSLGFLAAVGFWKAEVFGALDDLARWLKADEYVGYATIFLLIFLTTIPPLPLYSTLIVLSGYTFGAWRGLVLSYLASLAGALLVFLTSRLFLRAHIASFLSHTRALQRVVRALERRPALLFLVRLAPYPFNVMNCLLAAAPGLSLRTYAACTGLSLFKLIIHTTLGASVRSFAAYHAQPGTHSEGEGANDEENALAHWSTAAGIVLCVVLFVYLSFVARRAVDEELGDDAGADADSEERVAFLATYDSDSEDGAEMTEARTSRFVYAGLEEARIGL